MNMLLEMTDEKARRMLALSRELHWAFPTSQGTPIIKGQATSQLIEQAVQERESCATAARVLLGKGEEEGAVEIASNGYWPETSAVDERSSPAFLTMARRNRHGPDHSHYTVTLS